MFDIYGLVLFLSLVFYAAYVAVKIYLWKKHKKEGHVVVEDKKLVDTSKFRTEESRVGSVKQVSVKPKQEVDKELEKLKSFIQKNLKEGFNETVVVQALVKQGWSKAKVARAMQLAK
jgi:aspartyl/asparaginyl beta-hydroxylase (cupin superfamily)